MSAVSSWAKRKLRSVLKERLGLHIQRGSLPRGWDMFNDIAVQLPKLRMSLIYDVGAHLGHSTIDYQRRFPDAEIHCFEPVLETYTLMCRNFSEAGISPTSHRVAVSDEESISRMIYGTYKGQRFNDVNRLSTDGTGDEDVIVTTLDNLGCTKTVNLLKIDTEGGDLRVLEGARDMLSGQRLDLIQVEAGFSAANTTHVSFQKFNEYLSGYDFHVFGIYQQVNEWPTGNVNLRRADVVYASGKILAANRNTNDDD